MPWLISRRRLLILSVIDYLIILLSFSIMQSINFINTKIIAINFFALCWILVSYILDKYSIIEDDYDIDISNKLLRVIKTSILTGVLYKFIIIFFSIFNSNVGDGKWIFFIGIVSFFSFLYEIIHSYIINPPVRSVRGSAMQ